MLSCTEPICLDVFLNWKIIYATIAETAKWLNDVFLLLICVSQIFIYNQRTLDISLTYLLHLHCACISIDNIGGLACVITKVLITGHLHIYCDFQFCYILYKFPTRVFPWQGWYRGTICSTCQFHSLSNPWLGCYRSHRLYYSWVCKI